MSKLGSVKYLIRALLFLALAAIFVEAQSESSLNTTDAQGPSITPTTIIEVQAEEFDIAWNQHYLYLRVLSDGSAECQILERKSGDQRFDVADITSTRKVLSEQQLKRLQTVLGQQSTLKLNTVYRQRIADILDAGTVWDIKIAHSKRIQNVRVVEFAPDEAKEAKRPYPNSLLTLGCIINRLRADITGQSAYVDDECQNLPAR